MPLMLGIEIYTDTVPLEKVRGLETVGIMYSLSSDCLQRYAPTIAIIRVTSRGLPAGFGRAPQEA